MMTRTLDSDLTKLLRGTFYSLGSMVAVRILMIVNSVFVARLLGPERLGIVTIVDSILATAIWISTFGIPLAVAKYLSEFLASRQDRVTHLLVTALLLMLAFTGTTCAVLFACGNILSKLYNEPILAQMMLIVSATLLFASLTELGTSVLRGYQAIKTLSIFNLVKAMILLPVMILFVFLWGLKGAIMASLVGTIAGACVLLLLVQRHSRIPRLALSQTQPDILRGLVNYGLPTSLSAVLSSVPIWFSVTVMTIYAGVHDVGLYRVANSLTQALMFIPLAMSVPMVPIVSAIDAAGKEKLPSFFRRAFNLNMAVMIPATIWLALSSKIIISVLFGPSFFDAWRVLCLFCAGIYLSSLSALVGFVIAGTGRMWQGCGLNTIWAIVFVLLSYLLIRRVGLVGLGWSYLVSYAVHAIISMFYLRVNLKLRVRNTVGVILYPIAMFTLTYIMLNYAAPYSWVNIVLSISLAFLAVFLAVANLQKDEKAFVIAELRRCASPRASSR